MWDDLKELGLEPFWPNRKLNEAFMKKGLLLAFGCDGKGTRRLLVSFYSIMACCDVHWGEDYGQVFAGAKKLARENCLSEYVMAEPELDSYEGDYWFDRCEADVVIEWVVKQALDVLMRRQPKRRRNTSSDA